MQDFLLAGLAAWRLAKMLTGEAGPENLFGRLRAAVAPPTLNTGSGATTPGLVRRNLAAVLACPYCCSVWTAGGLWLVRGLPGVRWISDLLAVAGVAALLEVVVRRLVWEAPRSPLLGISTDSNVVLARGTPTSPGPASPVRPAGSSRPPE